MPALLENAKEAKFTAWGTVNTAAAPTKLPIEHSPRAQNTWVDEKPGSVLTAPGYLKAGDLPSGNPATFMYTFRKSDGSETVLISDGATLYRTKDFVTFTSIKTGLTNTFQLRAATLRDYVWLTNGVDPVMVFDGTSITDMDGSGGNALIPKGRSIAVWHERIWIGGIPSNQSSVRFSSLVDSTGAAVSPLYQGAWPADNEVQYGQDDGDSVYGLKVYKERLYAFKSKSIYRTIGSSEFTDDTSLSIQYGPVKTSSTAGTYWHDSIQERDNLLEFIGQDGFYEFDGENSVRTSDAVDSPDLTLMSFRNIQQFGIQRKSRVWSSSAQFDSGTLSKIVDSRVSGQIQIDNVVYDASDLPENDTPDWTKTEGSYISGATTTKSGITASELQPGAKLRLRAKRLSTSSNKEFIYYILEGETLSNTNGTMVGVRMAPITLTDSSQVVYLRLRDGTRGAAVKITSTTVELFNSYDLLGTFGTSLGSTTAYTILNTEHNFELKIAGSTATLYIDGTSVASGTAATTASTDVIFGVEAVNEGEIEVDFESVSIVYSTTGGTFTSEKYQVTDTIVAWGPFDSTFSKNGETLVFSVKSATTEAGLDAASWISIVPGSTPSFATANIWVQWKVEFGSVSRARTPIVEDASFSWIVGNAGAVLKDQVIKSVVWENRYWTTASGKNQTANNLIFVRGKREYGSPWQQKGGWSIDAFTIFNGQLFGSLSGSDDIVRLDVGYSLDGAAMDTSWETRDEVADADVYDKVLYEVIADIVRLGLYTVTLSISTDGGVTFPSANDISFSVDGTSRIMKRIKYNGVHGRQIRARIRTNGVDQPFELNGLTMIMRPRNIKP